MTAILPGQGNDVPGQRRLVIRSAGPLALSRSVLPEHTTDPPFRGSQLFPDVIDAATAPRRAHKSPGRLRQELNGHAGRLISGLLHHHQGRDRAFSRLTDASPLGAMSND